MNHSILRSKHILKANINVYCQRNKEDIESFLASKKFPHNINNNYSLLGQYNTKLNVYSSFPYTHKTPIVINFIYIIIIPS